MLTDGCSSPDTVHGILLVSTFGCFSTTILLDITVSEYYSILPKMHNIAQYYQYYPILPILLNITKITQYYLLTWSWTRSDLELFLDITQVLPILLKLPILPILHNITNITEYYNSKITNITQYYISNITQYSIGGIQYQYYSILLILLNITYSISLNIPDPRNCAFPVQYMSIFTNITSLFQC